jgi:hypothetical protein
MRLQLAPQTALSGDIRLSVGDHVDYVILSEAKDRARRATPPRE